VSLANVSSLNVSSIKMVLKVTKCFIIISNKIRSGIVAYKGLRVLSEECFPP
jgi:hypothetical protein